jgi:hypothetical protein
MALSCGAPQAYVTEGEGWWTMQKSRAPGLGVILACALAALLAPASVVAAKPGTPLDPALCSPNQSFSTTITNSYFPLPVGRRWVYQGREQGQTIGLRITVLNQTERLRFGGRSITTRVVEEVEWFDTNANGVIDAGEPLIEVSRNFFAQAANGTVCYFGEEVDIFNEDGTISHEGAWRADAPGNAPGIFMPANPQVGMTFQQENAPGVAEDTATIIRSGSYTVRAGTFPTTITVRDFNPLDGSKSTKVYAAGTGLIADGPLELISP